VKGSVAGNRAPCSRWRTASSGRCSRAA
jgi:hypothetical protein